MPQNDISTFADDVAANVIDQATYNALVARTQGFLTGIANSAQLNKVWRQATLMAYIVAQFICDETGDDVLDNGVPATILANFKNAIALGAGNKPARIVTVSTALVITTNDYAVGLDRTVAPAATAATLPAGAQVGQSFKIEDLVGNFNAFPVTVTPTTGGDSIAGLANFVCNRDRGSYEFRFYGSNLWSVSQS